MFNITRRLVAATILLFGILVAPATAWATPASIDDGQSPRDVGAHIDNGSGTPGPSFTTPIDIPNVGPAPTRPDKDAPQADWDRYTLAKQQHDQQVQERANAIALEHARQQALKAQQDARG